MYSTRPLRLLIILGFHCCGTVLAQSEIPDSAVPEVTTLLPEVGADVPRDELDLEVTTAALPAVGAEVPSKGVLFLELELAQEDDGQLFDSDTIESELLFPWSKNVCLSDSSAATVREKSTKTTSGGLYYQLLRYLLRPNSGCDRSLTGLNGRFQSPNYPAHYPNLTACTWYITVPLGYTVSLVLDDFSLEEDTGLFKKCIHDFMEVFDNYTRAGLLGRYCGSQDNLTFNSTSNVMTVVFMSDLSVERYGFSATYQAIPSGQVSDEAMTSRGLAWPTVAWSAYLNDSDTQMTCLEKFYNVSSRAVHLLLGKLCLPRASIDDNLRCRLGFLHGCTPVQVIQSNSEREMLQLVRQALRDQCQMGCHLATRKLCAIEFVQRTLEAILSNSVPPLEDCQDVLHGDSFKCLNEDSDKCKGDSWVTWYGSVIKKLANKTKLTCQALQNSDAQNTRQRRQVSGQETCDTQKVLECFTPFSTSMVDALFNGSTSQIYVFWKKKFPALIDCMDFHKTRCSSDFITKKKELVRRYVDDLVPKLSCGTAAAEQCVKKLDEASKLPDLDYSCGLMERTKKCIEENLENCTIEVEKKKVTDYFHRVENVFNHQCDKIVECSTSSILTLEEGGPPGSVKFKVFKDPIHICNKEKKCKVFIDFYPEHDGSPNCPNGVSMRQFGIYSNQSDFTKGEPCSLQITSKNWNKVLSVNLAATVDHMRDGRQRRRFKIILRRVRKTTEGYKLMDRRVVCTQEVDIIDNDSYASCMVITDPEIITFDNRHFVSLNIGAFYLLYRHTSLPIEVHASFQTCSNFIGSCACAVAVNVHDSVFYVDVCRQRNFKKNAQFIDCTDPKNRNKRRCIKRVIYHHHENKPPRFRLNRRGDTDFEIFLPHGGRVFIRELGSILNIYIRASPHDRNKTEGLCGTYDGDPSNDLMLRNGTLLADRYLTSDTLWGVVSHYPHFSEHWKIHEDDWLTGGAPISLDDYFSTYGMVCDCQKPETFAGKITDGAPNVMGQHIGILEMCHYNLKDITDDMIRLKPDNSATRGSIRTKRSTVDSEPYTLAAINSGNWTFNLAMDYCTKHLITESQTTRLCSNLEFFKSTLNVTACAVDIMLTGSTELVEGMLDALKQRCDVELEASVIFSQTEEGRMAASTVRDHLCTPECNASSSVCENGVCKCQEGFVGSDCSMRLDRIPRDVWLEEDGLCDKWRMSCSGIIITADHVVNSQLLTCHLQTVLIDEFSTKPINVSTISVSAVYLHSHMAACPLPPSVPRANESSNDDPLAYEGKLQIPLANEKKRNKRSIVGYYVSVSNDGSRFTEKQLFVPHDSRCHNCMMDMIDRTRTTCVFKENVCLTEKGECLEDGDKSSSNPCLICQPKRSQFELYLSQAGACSSATDVPLLILSVMFAIIFAVVIAIVAVVIVSKKRFGTVAKKFNFSSNASSMSSGSNSLDSIPNVATTGSTVNLVQSDSIALEDISAPDLNTGSHTNKALELD